MLTWNYRVFREEDGDYIIRSVTYDENGEIVGCTQDEVAPVGQSLKELAEDIKSFNDALKLPVLTLDDIPCKPKRKRERDRSKNLTIEQVRAELGLDKQSSNRRRAQWKNGNKCVLVAASRRKG
jgi:hypothetical protein